MTSSAASSTTNAQHDNQSTSGTPRPKQVAALHRNQLYQAVARGELGAIRIGRSIRIPKQALVDLLAAVSPRPSSGDE